MADLVAGAGPRPLAEIARTFCGVLAGLAAALLSGIGQPEPEPANPLPAR